MTGSGTQIDPYIITSYADLLGIESDMTAWYELGSNIDAVGQAFLPIGLITGDPFVGHLDGKGYRISNLTIHHTCTSDYEDFGLFLYVGSNPDKGYIKNLWLKDIDFEIDFDVYDAAEVGGLGGWISDGIIDQVIVTGSIVIHGGDGVELGGIGGFIGWASGGTVTSVLTRCWTNVNLSTDDDNAYVGGIAGYLNQSRMYDCFALGTIDANDAVGSVCGGIAGIIACMLDSSVHTWISNCYAKVDIDNLDPLWSGATGGFVGLTVETSIYHCYATGDVSSDPNAGGFSGYSGDSGWYTTECYWDTDTSGTFVDQGIGDQAAVGKTTAEMKTEATFVDWAFDTVWSLMSCNDGYPCLLSTTPSCSGGAGPSSIEVYFEYGVATGVYTFTTVHQTVLAIGVFLAVITHLQNNTIYYFRAVADNGTVIVYGVELTFETITPTTPYPPIVAGTSKGGGSTRLEMKSSLPPIVVVLPLITEKMTLKANTRT